MIKLKFCILVTFLIFGEFSVIAKVINLNTGWEVRNDTTRLTGITLPSGVFTELEKHKITESVLFSKNDVDLRWVGSTNWTYALLFEGSNEYFSYKHIVLTFHGLDTVANIYLNDVKLGRVDNMFTRYSFDIRSSLIQGSTNNLLVKFVAPIEEAARLAKEHEFTPPECPNARYHGICHMNMLRKMQASFSWDWGPAVPSVGIWKGVELELYNSAIIRDVTYHLTEHDSAWLLQTSVYLETGHSSNVVSVEGVVTLNFPELEGVTVQKDVTLTPTTDGEYTASLFLQIAKSRVEQWWPNGAGKQKLYTMVVRFEDCKLNSVADKTRSDWISEKSIKVGFRTIELVEEPTLNGLTFYFKVNGYPIFMKGSNFIPASILPELSADEDKLREILGAARDANMNMLRVWGGGLYESDLFYDITDEYGLLIWHDLMFACALYPAYDEFLESVKEEVRQNVRRISSHPSVAIWATNNENEVALRQGWYGHNSPQFETSYRKLYFDTVKVTVKSVDPNRVVLNSSPGNGQTFENVTIARNPQDYHYGDVHYYTYDLNLWDPRIYPRARFVSEYGFQSVASYRSWLTVKRDNEKLDDLIDHRQHFPFGSTPINILMEKNLPSLSPDSDNYWENYIYFSQVSQGIAIKTETNKYRVETAVNSSMLTMGALYWQLNDVWTTLSWSSIDFSGTWKILHNYIQQIFQSDVIVALKNLQQNFDLFVINEDLNTAKDYIVTVTYYRNSNLTAVKENSFNVTVPANKVKLIDTLDIYEEIRLRKRNYRKYTVEVTLKRQNDSTLLSRDVILLSPPREMLKVVDANVQTKILVSNCDSDKIGTAKILVTVSAPAFFVYLDVTTPQIQKYSFSDNGFIQFSTTKVVQLRFYSAVSCASVKNQLSIKSLTVNGFI